MKNNALILTNISTMMKRYDLWRFVKHVDLIKEDRIYVRVNGGIEAELIRNKDFGKTYPVAKVHHGLGSYYFRTKADDRFLDSYVSYRSKSNPSLQITLVKHNVSSSVADIDIDLANPFRDVWSSVVHAFEVLIPGKTNQKKVNKKLRASNEWSKYLT